MRATAYTLDAVILTLVTSLAAAGGLPSIRDSVTQPTHVYEGDDALITCVVRNAADNTVTWKKEERDRQRSRVLTAGETRVTADKRFSVLHDAVAPEDRIMSGGDVWVLVIKDANPADTGLYVCEVNSTPILRSFYKLSVLSRALEPPDNSSTPIVFDADAPRFDAKTHNYTDCCISSNVSKSCLGFCNIPSILDGKTGEDPENCEADFPSIVKCMADGRNHVPCCVQEGVPDICQDVCRGEYTIITDNIKTHFSCNAYTEQTLACIAEGVEILPSSPENLEVAATSGSSLQVSWTRPQRNAETVTEYVLNVTTLQEFDEDDEVPVEDSYATALRNNRKDEESTTRPRLERKQITVPGALYTTDVSSLKPYTMYEITITAVNKHGGSLPSYSVRAVTLPSGVVKPPLGNAPKLPDVKGCCIEKGVRHASCLDKLCDPVQTDIAEVTDLMICAPWAATSFNCLAGEMDHTSCCKARGLPDVCQQLCNGNVTQIGFAHFKCLKYMKEFSSCLLHGYGVLPSEPRKLRVAKRFPEFAIINWETPKELGDTVLYYDLHYRMLATYDNDYKIKAKVHAPFVLEGLKSDTKYEVFVEAVNVHGVGDPSSYIVFQTESKIEEITIEEAGSYNVTDCCVKTQLTDACMPLCSYDASMLDLKSLALPCGHELHKLIRCGAGGRDHTPCCSRRGVPAACLPLCGGVIVDSLAATAAACIPYIGNIVMCFEEGTDLLPGPTTGLHVVDVTTSSVSIAWDPPKDTPYTGFAIHYQMKSNSTRSLNDLKLENTISTNETSYTLTNLSKGQIYNIFVVTENHNGTSLPSSIIIINVTDSEEGQGSRSGVTSSPHSLAVSAHSANWITISWHPPQISHFAESITYALSYKSTSEEQYHNVSTTLTSHMLENLRPNTQYIAYVRAISSQGVSIPSETLVAWTDPAYPPFVEPPTVHPINLVIEGSSMTVLCIAMGTPLPNISLYISGRLVRQETTRHMVTVIHNVTRDMDQISCYADNGYGTPMQASKRIRISHIPKISAAGITIAARGDTVSLECTVDAYPEPKMLFWRDHSGRVPVIQGGQYDIHVDPIKDEESKWRMRLLISSITETDEGDYFCHAENAFGMASQAVSVRLRNIAASGNVSQCCVEQNVSSSCMDACSFALDIDAVSDKPECLTELDKLMKCAADGSDHRNCCVQKNVPRRCLDWCRGEPLYNPRNCVLSYTKQIMSCFSEGREKLPGPPLNVRVEQVDAHSVVVKWDKPTKNPQTVSMYRVFWRQMGSKIPMKNDTKETQLRIYELKDGTSYECVLKAGNQLGTSALTEPVRFTMMDKYMTSASSIETESSSAGVVVGIVLALIIVAGVVVGSIWFVRVRHMLGHKSNGGVAFENPSYLREVNGTQGNEAVGSHLNGITNTVAPEGGSMTPQQGWKQESLHSVQPCTEVPPSLYEELKLGQDGAGFKRLKP